MVCFRLFSGHVRSPAHLCGSHLLKQHCVHHHVFHHNRYFGVCHSGECSPKQTLGNKDLEQSGLGHVGLPSQMDAFARILG